MASIVLTLLHILITCIQRDKIKYSGSQKMSKFSCLELRQRSIIIGALQLGDIKWKNNPGNHTVGFILFGGFFVNHGGKLRFGQKQQARCFSETCNFLKKLLRMSSTCCLYWRHLFELVSVWKTPVHSLKQSRPKSCQMIPAPGWEEGIYTKDLITWGQIDHEAMKLSQNSRVTHWMTCRDLRPKKQRLPLVTHYNKKLNLAVSDFLKFDKQNSDDPEEDWKNCNIKSK